MAENEGQLILCDVEGLANVSARMFEGTMWQSQAEMAELFETDRSSITKHIKNIFAERELDENSVCANFAHTAADGKTYSVVNYNLDMIISVGYRVNSRIGTKFRQWATRKLNDYVTHGIVVDETKLAAGNPAFDRIVERIRAIRTSEKHFYQKITDVFATSTDYDRHSETAAKFFATAQNMFHYAVHGHTAAEIVKERSDRNKPFCGLTTWMGDVITHQDAQIAKNYLDEYEMKGLELLSEQFLSLAEGIVHFGQPMTMADWVAKLNEFLVLNQRPILNGLGKVSHSDMQKHARAELNAYNKGLAIANREAEARLPVAVQRALPARKE